VFDFMCDFSMHV